MLPEEITKFIGTGGGVTVYEVEKGAIKKFADAVDDLNPFYLDEEYAENSRYGSIIAPPGFFGWPARFARGSALPRATEAKGSSEQTTDPRATLGVALVEAGYPRVLDGGMEYDFFCPVRAGDTLAASSVIKDVIGREGSTGKMAFVITETTYTNQNGELVAKARATSIHR